MTPVAGEVDETVRRADDDSDVAGDGVKRVDKFNRKVFGDLDFFVFERVDGDVVQIRFVRKLGHLAFNHADGEVGAVNRRSGIEFWQEVAASADVVEVSVSEANCLDVVFVVFEIFDVRDEIVDARVVAVSKEDAHVDDEHFVLIFDDGHVFADAGFAETANRDDADGFRIGTGLLNHRIGDLFAVVAVVAGFVDGDADDVLSRLSVDVLRKHTLMMNHFPLAGGDGEVNLALFYFGLGGLGRFFGLIRLFLLFWLWLFLVFDKIGVFTARGEVAVEIAFLSFFEAFFDIGETLDALF